jgi:hypothetical protein
MHDGVREGKVQAEGWISRAERIIFHRSFEIFHLSFKNYGPLIRRLDPAIRQSRT